MITIVAAVILAALVILERKQSIRMEYAAGSSLLMIGGALACGLYGFDFTRTIISLFGNLIGMDPEFADAVMMPKGAGLILSAVVQFLLLVPMAIGALYIFITIAKTPFGRGSPVKGEYFAAKNGARTARLSATASLVMLAGGVISLLLTIPYWKEFIQSLALLNPIFLFFLLVFTGGIALPFLGLFLVMMNAQLLSIITFGMVFVMMLYGYSVLLGIVSAVRANRSGRVQPFEAVVCGALALLPVWSVIPMRYLEKKMKV